MSWIRSRPLLIGVGAAVVAAMAIGVIAVGAHHRHRHELFRFAASLEARPGIAPFGGGPFGGRFGGGWFAPGFKGGPMPQRYRDAVPQPPSPDLAPGFASPMIGGVLHGELTVPTPDGTYETIDVQRGQVTKVSSSAMTVRSSDGFTKTYAATAPITRGIKVGEGVKLRAAVSHGKATITSLTAAGPAE